MLCDILNVVGLVTYQLDEGFNNDKVFTFCKIVLFLHRTIVNKYHGNSNQLVSNEMI